MKDRFIIVLVAIICITLLEVTAMLQGFDGMMFASVIAGILAIIGYVFGKTEAIEKSLKNR